MGISRLLIRLQAADRLPTHVERSKRFAELLRRIGIISAKGRSFRDPAGDDDPIFTSTESAIEYLKKVRWAGSPICPDPACKRAIGWQHGGRTNPGLFRCSQCGNSFSYRSGTGMSGSHVPPEIWLKALWFVAGQRRRITTEALVELTSVNEKTARMLMKRIAVPSRNQSPSPSAPAPKRHWPRYNQFFPEDDPRQGTASRRRRYEPMNTPPW